MELSCRNLSCHRTDWQGGRSVCIAEITAQFLPGALCGVVGPEDSGRDLLVHVLGLLETPDSGEVLLDGRNLCDLPTEERTQTRNRNFGFLFSQPALLPAFTAAENVAMPLFRILGVDAGQAQTRTLEVLDRLGIAGEGDTLASDLAPDLAWRVALARTLVHRPSVVLAVAPKAPADLPLLFRALIEESGACGLWSGSREAVASHCRRVIGLHAGRIVEDSEP